MVLWFDVSKQRRGTPPATSWRRIGIGGNGCKPSIRWQWQSVIQAKTSFGLASSSAFVLLELWKDDLLRGCLDVAPWEPAHAALLVLIKVVLKVAKALPDGEQIKPPGSMGVVLESPPHNHDPYLVRFTDGETVKAYFHELALRRREVEDELGAVSADLRPYVIYRCRVGSKAFGLASDNSDDDLRGIYLPPARLNWSLRRLPEQLEFADEDRHEVYWELEKFLRLALKANPSVLETLWTTGLCSGG